MGESWLGLLVNVKVGTWCAQAVRIGLVTGRYAEKMPTPTSTVERQEQHRKCQVVLQHVQQLTLVWSMASRRVHRAAKVSAGLSLHPRTSPRPHDCSFQSYHILHLSTINAKGDDLPRR